MSTDTQQAPTAARRLPTRRLVATGVVMLVGYWSVARGSMVGAIGAVAADGSWRDGQGQPTTEAPLTYAIELGPSPLIVVIVLASLILALATREVRGRLAWLAPSCEMAAIVVPVLAAIATFAWIHGFDPAWTSEVSITAPWWARSSIAIDHLR